jgi:Protein of unknown function (DUF2911)
MKAGYVYLMVVAALAASAAYGADRGSASASVGGKKVSIDYGRPSLKGRSFDELLKQLPEDRVWRAGENQVTTLTSEGEIQIGGKKLAPGKYSLYVHLGADGSRSLLVNSDLGIPLVKLWDKAPANVANEPWPRLDGYAKNIAGKEVARVTLKKETTAAAVDTFVVGLTPAGSGAVLKLAWGNESWSADVR